MIVNALQKEVTQLRKLHKANANLNQLLAEIAESLKAHSTLTTSQLEELPIQKIIKAITFLPLQVQSIKHSLQLIHSLQTINALKYQDNLTLLAYLLQIQHPELDLLIIRIIPPFFTFASLSNEAYYSQIFTILFRLAHSTSPIAQTTSIGALLQFTSHLVQEYQNQPLLKK